MFIGCREEVEKLRNEEYDPNLDVYLNEFDENTSKSESVANQALADQAFADQALDFLLMNTKIFCFFPEFSPDSSFASSLGAFKEPPLIDKGFETNNSQYTESSSDDVNALNSSYKQNDLQKKMEEEKKRILTNI